MKTFQIYGRIIDRETQEGLAGLRVEAWDKDLICNDLVGSAITDDQGAFKVAFDESYFRELFLDQQPDLFFKVFQSDRLIKSTEDSVLWNVAAGDTQIVIEVEEVEKMAFKKLLLEGELIPKGEEKRLFPHLIVENYDRLHFHISAGNRAIKGLKARILFGTPYDNDCGALLADSTVWFEETVSEREFSYTTPNDYNGTGFVMSVPVIAPLLYDVILKNVGDADLESVYVAVMAQEI